MSKNRQRQSLSGSALHLALVVGILATIDLTPVFGIGPGPSLVSVSGRQLIVQKRNLDGSTAPPAPYIIRGAVWSPASRITSTSTTDSNNANKRRPEFRIWYTKDIPLLADMNVNTVRLVIDPGFDATLGPFGLRTLDALHARGIMVIMTVDDGINSLSRISSAVNFYKDHPAILMWMLGNEWNINRYYGVANSAADAAQRTENAAALIKSIDPNHPVSTSYGDIDIDGSGLRFEDTKHYVNDVATSVDVWGLNIYRGESFGTLFSQWASISAKPMFLSEFGTDAFFSSCARTNPPEGTLDERVQGVWDLSLWNEVVKNLSATDPTRVALGATVFEFNDEWWKVQPSGTQERSGFLFVNGHPDDFANEEYFGIVDIDRKPRGIYHVLRRAFAAGAQPGPSLSPPPRRVDFFSLPETIKTNIPAFVVAGTVQRSSRVFVNGTEVSVDSGGNFVTRFPPLGFQNLTIGPNTIEVQVTSTSGSSILATKKIVYESSFSTAETRLLYVDSVSASLPGTVVIDLDAGVLLGLLDQQHVRGISSDGSAIYTQSRAVISTASHAITGPPLSFSGDIPSNGFLVSPLGDYLYSGNEIVDRSSNSLLSNRLPTSVVTGSSFLSAPVPGGPSITPDGQFIYRTTSNNSITKIDLVSLTSTTMAVPSEGAFVSDLSVSPGGTILGRGIYGGGGFFASFYDASTLTRLGSTQISSDFSGELVFSSQGECAVIGGSGNPAFRQGGLTAIELSSFLQRSCSLIDLADEIIISNRNELYVSSGTRFGVDVLDLQPCGAMQRRRTYYLGINKFTQSSGIPRNDEIRRIVLRDLPTLNVETMGVGGGVIKSLPEGISCGSDCIEGYLYGTVVTLTPTPEPDSVFSAWIGDPDCTDGVVTMLAGKNCMAVFDRQVQPPASPYLESSFIPGFRFRVRITNQGGETPEVHQQSNCIPETLCVSGVLPGRSELFLRVVGPKPNGYLWPTIVKFTTSQVEVWIEQKGTGKMKYYLLPGTSADSGTLAGLFDRVGFLSSAALYGALDEPAINIPVQPQFNWKGLGLPPPTGPYLTTPQIPGFRFKVRITIPSGGRPLVHMESDCIAETLCVSGALPGRSEVFLRVVGPKPNSYLWPTLVKFTTSKVEVWIEKLNTGQVQYYLLPESSPDSGDLAGLFDRFGFLP